MNIRALIRVCICVASLTTIFARSLGAAGPPPESLAPYVGIYSGKQEAFISIAIFDPGDGQNRLLFTDLASGQIRVLASGTENTFEAGPGLLLPSPVEMQIVFHRHGAEDAKSLVAQKGGMAEGTATRVPCHDEEVTFRNGDISLAGTLATPSSGHKHAAVVFLHGSGGLNRYSFGPFPDFFLSQGFAVLVYDKRGTGRSSGDLDSATLSDLAGDGRAAVRFLKEKKNIDPRRIGLCGASQGGFLAAAVASGNPDVAFMINLYGMYVPVWQQELYRTESEMRAEKIPEPEIAEALAFVKKEFDVGKTGAGWAELETIIHQSKEKKWWEFVTKTSSLEELRHYWQTLYSYDPSLPLEKVTCPILALFGELDTSTPVQQTVDNMQGALKVAQNSDFTCKVFAKAGHGLLESETGARSEIPKAKRLAPGLFELMTNWLRKEQSH